MMPLITHFAGSGRSPDRDVPLVIRLSCQLLAAIGGAAVFAPPFGYLGSTYDRVILGTDAIGSRTIVGTCAGAVTGAVLGCGLLNGFIGSIVIWIVGAAVVFAMIGPGCDADPVPSALVGAAVGLFLGLTTWRGLALLLAMLVAVNLLALFMAGNVPPGAVVLGLATALGAGALYRAFRPRPLSAEALPEPPTSHAATASTPRGDGARDHG